MRRSTKAQIQVGETVAVILVFMVFLIFGLFWWNSSSAASDEVTRDTQTRLSLLETTKEVMNMPEIHCSIAGKQDTTCIDWYRVVALQQQLAADQTTTEAYASRFFGYKLTLDTRYPPSNEDPNMHTVAIGSTTIFDFTPPTHDTVQAVTVPIVVHHPLTETRYFGMLIIEQFTQTGLTTQAPEAIP